MTRYKFTDLISTLVIGLILGFFIGFVIGGVYEAYTTDSKVVLSPN